MSWIDDWLEGVVHRSARQSPTERSRHERFIVARAVSALTALAALPLYLVVRGVPSLTEFLAVLALSSPLAAVLLTARTGRMVLGQGVVSVVIGLLALLLVPARGDLVAALALLGLVVPLDSLFCGAKRAILPAAVVSVLGTAIVLVLVAAGLAPPKGEAGSIALAVGTALAIGHAFSIAVQDRRMKGLIAEALSLRVAHDSSILESIDDLVTWHDRNGLVLKANAAASRLVGVPVSTLLERGLLARIHTSDRPLFLRAISDAARSSEPVVVRFRVEKPGRADSSGAPVPDTWANSRAVQEAIWMETRAHRVPNASAGEATVVAVTRSIEDHVVQAQEFERLKRSAEQGAMARTRLLAQACQELRLPAQTIAGFADLLRARNVQPRGDETPAYVEAIRSAGRALLGTVSKLSDLSKIETGTYDIELEPVAVDEVVQDFTEALGDAWAPNASRIVSDVPPGLPPLRIDRRACRDLLTVLAEMVQKAVPAGTMLELRARRKGERVCLTVGVASPTGRAIASGRFGDGGLALQVARGLADLHHGRIALIVGSQGPEAMLSLPAERHGKSPMSERSAASPIPAVCGMLAFKMD
ncbi:PAS domain-containing protein [Microvirga massiliensis]|uniref:sensor histidine kinase n=1 Tax=Microvirga massiliensis TaxID=1033741 RepID=UPI00062B74C9|nr:histidine kinase dimerization/phospho-acceptor domain-containing protein [Microvirga massiliensis]